MSKFATLSVAVIFSLVLIGAGCAKEQPQDANQDSAQPVMDSTAENDSSPDSTTMETPAPDAMVNGSEPVDEMIVEPLTKGGQEIEENEEEKPAPQVRRFDLVARQWEFEPSVIEVNEGDTVQLNITSVDVAHGFVLNAFGVNGRLEPGQTVNIEFVADKKGTFTFICNVFCGSGHGGMKGSLIVR